MSTFSVGLYTTLIGMGGVFAVLLIITIFTSITNKVVEKFSSKKANAAVTVAPIAAAVAVGQPAQGGEKGISPKTVAAIMAAIQAASGGGQLKFVAIRRGQTFQSPWSSSSNIEIISARQQYL